jgi:hypothetical protein
MKYTVTQVRFIMKRLRQLSRSVIQELEPQLKEALVTSQLDDKDLEKWITKMVYDKPQAVVNMVLKWADGEPPSPVSLRPTKKKQLWETYNAVVEELHRVAADTLSTVESQLLFDDDWDTEYPDYLESELVDALVSVVNDEGGTEDDD